MTLAAWQGLAHNVQEVWNLIARDAQPHRPPFGTDSHISGFNLLVSAYHGFARLGTEKIPEPRAWEEILCKRRPPVHFFWCIFIEVERKKKCLVDNYKALFCVYLSGE